MTPEERAVIDAAISFVTDDSITSVAGIQSAVSALLAADDTCHCSPDVREYCHSSQCRGGDNIALTWVTRTWVDVREGDVIRPPGIDGAEAKVAAIGPVVAWGVNDLQPLDAYQQRDIQYNPAKYAGSYAVRRATFGDPPITREMKPGAPVDIRVSLAEAKAIEALGGWAERVAAIDNPE